MENEVKPQRHAVLLSIFCFSHSYLSCSIVFVLNWFFEKELVGEKLFWSKVWLKIAFVYRTRFVCSDAISGNLRVFFFGRTNLKLIDMQKSSRGSGGMLTRKNFENLHAVMAILELFEWFLSKFCLNYLTLILSASLVFDFELSTKATPKRVWICPTHCASAAFSW